MRRIVNILAKMVSAIVLALIFLPLLVELLSGILVCSDYGPRGASD